MNASDDPHLTAAHLTAETRPPLGGTSYCYPAEMQALDALLNTITNICLAAGLDQHTQLRIQLVMEELFTNSVLHGYAKEQAPTSSCNEKNCIWLHASPHAEYLSLIYQDAAPAYNPLTQAKRYAHSPHDTRPIGGMGVELIEKLAHSVHYEHTEGRNTLYLKFR